MTRSVPKVARLLRAAYLLGIGLAALAFADADAVATTATGPAPTIERRMAVTVDDLPWASLGESTPPDLARFHARLIAGMRDSKAPIIGFVNEGKLVSAGRVDTSRVHLLRDWVQAGFDLGNHTRGHIDLHAVGLDEYESDILAGETFLKPLLAEHGKKPEWFRHPYLRAGRSVQDKQALAEFLALHGYRIAPVTVDNSDWIWALAYRRALAAGDEAALLRLREEYVPYMVAKVDYFEKQSIALLGYNLPHILLLHANELNADMFAPLLAAIAARGYQFVTLTDALADPAYARPDLYTGKWGPSWIHRWAIGEARPKEFFAGEPKTAAWVLALAGVDSE